MILVAIQDTVSKLYLAPFVEHNDDTAKRTFAVLCREPGMISKSPADYQIFRIGEYDETHGMVKPSLHELLMTGSEVVKGE